MNEIYQKVLEEKIKLLRIFPNISNIGLDLLISSSTDYNPFIESRDVVKWIEDLNKRTFFRNEIIPLHNLVDWRFDNNSILKHKSERFFSIDWIKVIIDKNLEFNKTWVQPIINQPEIGILGIITQKKNGVLYFLLQGKIEPGNINGVQLSPTVQATRSNFTQVHGGNKPKYLEYFLKMNKNTIIVDQLQSEQGARFLKKRNRNVIIEIPKNEKIKLADNFIWLTLRQVKELLKEPNIVNMDTRTVLACTQLK